VITVTIDASASGLRPDQVLRAAAPGLGRAEVMRLLRAGRLLVNGHAAKLATPLREGDVLVAKVAEARATARPLRLQAAQTLPQGMGLFHLDAQLCVVDKPSGMATHPGTGAPRGTTLTDKVMELLASRGQTPVVAPSAAGRLDRGTSGIVVLGLTHEAQVALGRAYESGEAHKVYLALCQGQTPASFQVDVPLVVRRFSGGESHKKLKEARTLFTRLAGTDHASLVAAVPETGRTHQIRRHLKRAGHPVVGDDRYALPGKTWAHATQMCLHMHRLTFKHPATGQLVEVVSPPPQAFMEAMATAGLPPGAWRRLSGS
jgi:23S rRNA pseudouridine955/2504/2580 synthase